MWDLKDSQEIFFIEIKDTFQKSQKKLLRKINSQINGNHEQPEDFLVTNGQ